MGQEVRGSRPRGGTKSVICSAVEVARDWQQVSLPKINECYRYCALARVVATQLIFSAIVEKVSLSPEISQRLALLNLR